MQISLETLRNTKGIGSKTLERIIEQHEIDNNIKSYKSEYIPSEEYQINEDINLWQGDCLKLMEYIPDKSVNMILCDLPYGTTACSWDTVIPFKPLWSHYKRIIKDNGAIVLFGSEPFSTNLRMSNLDWYKYDWIWKKTKASNFALCRVNPMKYHELISVFYNNTPTFNLFNLRKLDKPIMSSRANKGGLLGHCVDKGNYYQKESGFHNSILEYSNGANAGHLHPTQKPVELLEYLIKTYTNEDMTVLDNCMGSGSTGVACKNLNRKFIGIELDEEYFNIAKERING